MHINKFKFPKSIGAVSGIAVLGALNCPLMSDHAKTSDIDNAPVPTTVVAVASGASVATAGFFYVPETILGGDVAGSHADPYRSASIIWLPVGQGRNR